MLVIAVNFMSLTFFLPLIWYASAYLTDNMNFRLQAIKALLITLSFAGSLAIFLGAEILLLFLKSKLPQYDTIITFSIGAFVVVFGAFAVVATFGFSFIILSHLASWLRKSMPKRVKREKMHLTPFLQVFITIHPIMFAFLAGLSVVALVAFYLFWSIAVIITSPLQDFWQEPFLIGWLFSIIPLIAFLARIRRLNRAFARLFKEQSKIVEK
jgi:MFS family permease